MLNLTKNANSICSGAQKKKKCPNERLKIYHHDKPILITALGQVSLNYFSRNKSIKT